MSSFDRETPCPHCGGRLIETAAGIICAMHCRGIPTAVAVAAERPVRLRAGFYDYRGRLIVRTEWERPVRGVLHKWELADWDRGAVLIEGLETYRTMRDAVAALDREHEQTRHRPTPT